MMRCPACHSDRIQGTGRQIVDISEYYREEDLHSYETEGWHEKLGRWAWTCRACDHQWPTQEQPDYAPRDDLDPRMRPAEIHATAQWIIETALEAEACLVRGDSEGVRVGLEAIATYAHNIFQATPAKGEPV